MLKFFRRIRQNLLMENKTGKYFKYAIGEIILVVVGILIALSINNWNEGKKRTAQEVKILKEIQNELKGAIGDLNSDIESHHRNRNSTIIIRNEILFNREYHDSLNIHFWYMIDDEVLRAKKSAFESLQSIGLEIISNDSIRQKITTAYLYMNDFTDGENRANNLAITLMEIIEPHIVVDRELLISDPKLTNMEYWGRRLPFKFSNYNELLNNEAFLFNIMSIIDERILAIELSERFKKGLEEVISNIDIELKRLE